MMQSQFLAYLPRLWQATADSLLSGHPSCCEAQTSDPPRWHAPLQSPQSDERGGSAELVDVFAFLVNETRLGAPYPEGSGAEGDGLVSAPGW